MLKFWSLKQRGLKQLAVVLLISTTLPAFPVFGADITYKVMAIMDSTQLTQLVQKHIEKSKRATNRVQSLKDILKAVLSRHDKDDSLSTILPLIKSELDDLKSYTPVMISLANAAVATLQKPEDVPAVQQVTQAIILENIMSELRPEIKKKKEVAAMFARIRDAKIELTDECKGERKIGLMQGSVSPSKIAEKILEIK